MKSLPFGPLIRMLVKFSATLLLFVSVTVLRALVVARAWLPKLIVPPESVTGCTPVPVRFTDCGLFVALSVNASVAVLAPSVIGANLTLTVHEVWPASVARHVVAD